MSKNILITGGAGFIAHHAIEYILNHTDWDIVSLDRLDFSGNLNRIQEVVGGREDKGKLPTVLVVFGAHHIYRQRIRPVRR